ncbi:MAG: nucleotidyltransferase domain-containing protein [Deltaproteobacteria bacterium]|nr:nucleotidyltransferase domain-containing protein [Deltaproteobacteria bacterium]
MIQIDTSQIETICRRYPVRSLALFGSVTDDSFNVDSDVDVIIDFDESSEQNYFDCYFNLKTELEAYWNRTVDLVANKKFRNKHFEASLENSKHVIYERKNS